MKNPTCEWWMLFHIIEAVYLRTIKLESIEEFAPTTSVKSGRPKKLHA